MAVRRAEDREKLEMMCLHADKKEKDLLWLTLKDTAHLIKLSHLNLFQSLK